MCIHMANLSHVLLEYIHHSAQRLVGATVNVIHMRIELDQCV